MQARAVVFAMLLGAPAAAQTDTYELTGRELYELCARNDDFCVGFIAGAVSTTRASRAKPAPWCWSAHALPS